jgi:hypothetical protein
MTQHVRSPSLLSQLNAPFQRILLTKRSGGYAKLNFWVIGEGYVIIIVASTPLLNSLVKWGKEKTTQRSYGSTEYTENQTTIKQSWTIDQEEQSYNENSGYHAM